MVIDIFLDSFEDIFHTYSNTTLNPELASYIYDECTGYHKKTNITFEIACKKKLDDVQKQTITYLIKNHFSQIIKEKEIDDKLEIILYLVFALIGTIAVVIASAIKIDIVSELFTIFGWVLIWELIENLIFKETRENIKIQRCKQIVAANIVFID